MSHGKDEALFRFGFQISTTNVHIQSPRNNDIIPHIDLHLDQLLSVHLIGGSAKVKKIVVAAFMGVKSRNYMKSW